MPDTIDVTATNLIDCVCEALAAAERPVCKCYKTIGPPIIGPGQCCQCDDATGEATIHFERLYPADPTTLEQVPRLGCKNGAYAADFSIVVTRCAPRIDETGTMPDADEQDTAAADMHADIGDVLAALSCGCHNYVTIVREIAVDSMPDAGCSVLGCRVTVEVKPGPTVVVGS